MVAMQMMAMNSSHMAQLCREVHCRRVGAEAFHLLPRVCGGMEEQRKGSFTHGERLPLLLWRNGLERGRNLQICSLSSAKRMVFSSRRRVLSVCQVAVESGASKEAAAEESLDGSVLTGDGSELKNTRRLVESAMLAATAGLAYFLSNLFRLEGYFGCFFPLPLVISSMQWGPSAGRKTMVATALLLLVLTGPLKAASYLLMHGFVGLTMGVLWRWRINWLVSLAVCTVVRCFGSVGFVLLSSWLLRENLLALITINAHASIAYMLAALGINIIPTMTMIYFIFATLVFLNCGCFVFLLHVLYAIFLKRLGIEINIAVPKWIEKAM